MSKSDQSSTMSKKVARATYAIDPRVSRFTVRASAGGLLAAFAHNPTFAVRRFTARVSFDPGAPAEATAGFVVDAASLELTDQVSDSDRREIERVMRNEVLEVARFPTVEFQSDRIDAHHVGGGRFHASASGRFALHGVTRDVTIEADAVSQGASLRVYGEWAMLQTDFGIRLVSVAAQAIKVKDELRCSFDLVGRRQE